MSYILIYFSREGARASIFFIGLFFVVREGGGSADKRVSHGHRRSQESNEFGLDKSRSNVFHSHSEPQQKHGNYGYGRSNLATNEERQNLREVGGNQNQQTGI